MNCARWKKFTATQLRSCVVVLSACVLIGLAPTQRVASAQVVMADHASLCTRAFNASMG